MSLLLSFIIPSVTLHFGRLALICDLVHIKPLPPSHSLHILVYFFLSHVLSIVASYSLDSRSHPSWSLRHSTAYKIFFCFFSFKHAFFFFSYLSLLLSHATSFQTPFFLFPCLVVFFMFASSSLSLLFISADKYLNMSALTWHHCSLLELRVFRSRSRGWRREHAALSNVHLSLFFLLFFVTKSCRTVPEQPITDIFVLIMSKWARWQSAVANTSIYPTRILGYLGRILADVASAQTFFRSY